MLLVRSLLLLFLLIPISSFALVDNNATNETVALYGKLQDAQGEYVYWGYHQPFRWSTTSGVDRNIGIPDSYQIAQVYPYVFSFNFANNTGTNEADNATASEWLLKRHYRNGGMIQMHWSMTNWANGNTSGNTTGNTVVAILPGGDNRTEYLTQLDIFASWCRNFTDDRSRPIPMLFRPFHEVDGAWSWWGVANASNYKALWQDLVVYLRDNQSVHNLIYVYAPEFQYNGNKSQDCYAGDDYVDIVGIDQYKNTAVLAMPYYQNASDFAVAHNKLFAICEGLAEVSNETIANENYWNETYLNPVLNDSKASKACYIVAFTTYNWGPYANKISNASFYNMTQNPKIRMLQYHNVFLNNANITHGTIN